LKDKTEPRYLDWWETLGQHYLEIGQVDEAIEAFRTYISINPDLVTIIRENAKVGNFPKEIYDALLEE
jgi:hypothetical protein